jgi:hypothetical protein
MSIRASDGVVLREGEHEENSGDNEVRMGEFKERDGSLGIHAGCMYSMELSIRKHLSFFFFFFFFFSLSL